MFLEGVFYKVVVSLDMIVLSSVFLGFWKKMFYCGFKERRIMSFFLVIF